jgi:phage-related protein
MGDSLERLRQFPESARADAGYQLELVQQGHRPIDFRPMPEVGPGVTEIRVHEGNKYRIFFVARFEEAVYVLHCFEKKTQKTRQADIRLGQRRYRALLERRTNEGHEK